MCAHSENTSKYKPDLKLIFWSFNIPKYHASNWYCICLAVYIFTLRIQNCGNSFTLCSNFEYNNNNIWNVHFQNNNVYSESGYNRLIWKFGFIWKSIGNVYVSFIFISDVLSKWLISGWDCNILYTVCFSVSFFFRICVCISCGIQYCNAFFFLLKIARNFPQI